MNEFFSSLLEHLHRRATTSIIATYVFFWATYHWQGIYTTLFVSQDQIFNKFGLLKNEYVNKYFFGNWTDPSYYFGIVVPAIATFLFIWVLPKYLFIPAFKKEREYKLDRRKIIIDGDTRFEEVKTRLAEKTTKTIEAQIKQVEATQEIVALDPTIVRKQEFDAFISNPEARQALTDIIQTVYEFKGNTVRYIEGSSWHGKSLNANSLAMAHSNDLVEITEGGDRIVLTEKGKYFISRYQA